MATSSTFLRNFLSRKQFSELQKYLWWTEKAEKITVRRDIPRTDENTPDLPHFQIRSARYVGRELKISTPSEGLAEKYRFLADVLNVPFEGEAGEGFQPFVDYVNDSLGDSKKILAWGPKSLYSRMKRKLHRKHWEEYALPGTDLKFFKTDVGNKDLIYFDFYPYGDLSGKVVAGVKNVDFVVSVSSAGSFGTYRELLTPKRSIYYDSSGFAGEAGIPEGDPVVTVEHILLEDEEFIRSALFLRPAGIECELYHVFNSISPDRVAAVLYPVDDIIYGDQFVSTKKDSIRSEAVNYAVELLVNELSGDYHGVGEG